MMNGINGMNGMLETNGVSNGVNSMQMPVPSGRSDLPTNH